MRTSYDICKFILQISKYGDASPAFSVVFQSLIYWIAAEALRLGQLTRSTPRFPNCLVEVTTTCQKLPSKSNYYVAVFFVAKAPQWQVLFSTFSHNTDMSGNALQEKCL